MHKPPPYQYYRQRIGYHTNWQDNRQGSQQYQDDLIQRLASVPGRHSENVHRQDTAQAMVQLLAILSTAEPGRARPTATVKSANAVSRVNTTYYDDAASPAPLTGRAATTSFDHPGYSSKGLFEVRTQQYVPATSFAQPTSLDDSRNRQPGLTEARNADYSINAVLGMPLEAWCVKQLQIMQSYRHLSFNNGHLERTLYNVMRRPTGKGTLSPEARAFYKNNLVRKLAPTLTLQLNKEDSAALSDMNITEPQWGFIHAGAMLLVDSGAELNGLTLADIEDTGITLYAMLSQGASPLEYAGYFRLPALLYYAETGPNMPTLLAMSEQDRQQVFLRYFDYIKYWQRRHNPLAQFAELIDGWQTRTELARQSLARHSVSDEWVESYLNSHGETQFETRKWVSLELYDGTSFHEVKYPVANGTVSLPNIDTVFAEQNRKLAEAAYEVDKLLLPSVFDSLSEQEQRFIEQAKVDRVRIQFNAEDTIRWVPLAPAARRGITQSNALIYRIPERIDLLQCTLNGVERIYALDTSPKTGKYRLNWVDRDRQALLWLLDDMTVPYGDPEYKVRVTSHLNLKKAGERPQQLIENLANHHKQKLLTGLDAQGYDKTTREKVVDFLLGLVPFYTCITESIKGNQQEAISACIMDVASLLPFIGQAVAIKMRFGTALVRSTATALKYGAKQATIRGVLKQTGKGLMDGLPSIGREISPEVLRKLGVRLIRDVDPGFEILASGGAKAARAMIEVFSKIPNKSPGLFRLSDALHRKAAGLVSIPVNKHLNVEFPSGKLSHTDQKPVQVRGQPEPASAAEKASGSELKLNTASEIRSYALAHSIKLEKYPISDTHYIQYYAKSLNNAKGSEVLVVSAHGGFMDSDLAEPVVVLPADITIQMLTPHGTMLNNPKLENVVNAGKNLRAYVSITNGEVSNVNFLPQKSHPKWLFADDYDPENVINTLGREDGLQNYRHIRYERESDLLIAQVLIKNRELAKKGEAVLTDVLTVDTKISTLEKTSLQAASVQRVIDLDKAGKLLNEQGERYKTIAFCHCRCSFEQPYESLPLYFMEPLQLESYLKKTAAKGSTSSEVKMTVLQRKETGGEFEIKHYSLGRFMFTPVSQSIQNMHSTMRP